ncbi:tetratricopeptide repeat protein [Caenimonas terrae]|uniref:Tetratricopeptide repeat protein n=1 Tax=Caenimonas terrae TaxID=696074 RepID=A0ABW0NI86_9BURK
MQARTLLLALVAVALNVHAADEPGSSPATPSARERMTIARKALAVHDYNKAVAELSTVVRADPGNAEAHSLLGYSYRKSPSPDLAKAFEHYNTALRIDPRHKGAHEYIGEAYLTERKPEEAQKHLAELERICGNRSCEEYADLSKAIAEYQAKN